MSREFLIDNFLKEMRYKLNDDNFIKLENKLKSLSDEEINKKLDPLNEELLTYKNPSTAIIISILGGWLGLDRIHVGDYIFALLKFITGGGLGIWWIADIFLIGRRVKKINFKRIKKILIYIKNYLGKFMCETKYLSNIVNAYDSLYDSYCKKVADI